MRVALYWTPPLGDPLFDAGNEWLGRDPETGASLRQPAIPNLPELTVDPRRYGFHCTLRPPMHLATSWEDFLAAAEDLAAASRPFVLPALAVTNLGGFLALTLTTPCLNLHHLADACIRATNAHRAPPSRAELARRHEAGLSPRQEALLERWGYPYVMQEWVFHMTLTRRLTDAQSALLLPSAQQHFADSLAMPRMVEEICVFTQGDSDFLIAERLDLG